MSIKNIFKIILFMSILFQVLLVDKSKIDMEKTTIKKMRGTIFKNNDEKIYYLGSLISDSTIIAFADINNDKYTDIITYKKEENTFTFYIYLYYPNSEDLYFSSSTNFDITIDNSTVNDINDVDVRNVHVGSFSDSGEYCLLITFNDNTNKLLHYIACVGENDSIKKSELKDISSNILILNRDKDNYPRLLFSDYNDNYKTKICILQYEDNKYSCKDKKNFEDYVDNANYLNQKLSLSGGLAYVDVSGDCVPDIILSHDDDENNKRTIEVYVSNRNRNEKEDDKYELKDVIQITDCDKYGAFAINKINDEKDESKLPLFDMIIPKVDTNEIFILKNQVNIEYSWSKYYCEETSEDKVPSKIFEDFNKNGGTKLSITNIDDANIQLDSNFPTVIRFGDFKASSNPGIIVKQIIKQDDGSYSQISLFERKEEKFQYYDGITIDDIKSVDSDSVVKEDDFRMGVFFDIDESGSYSFILPTQKKKNYFFFNYQKNTFFLKEKLVNDKNYFYDTNLGASYRYIVNDKNGDRHMDVTSQLAQTSDTNIPLPFALNGLDGTNNYVEYFETISGNYYSDSSKFKTKDEQNYYDNTPIIPNTQSMVYKFYNSKNKIEWDIELMLTPMSKMWLFFIIVVMVMIIVLAIIIFLHVRELKEEQKETTKFKSWFA